MGDWTVYTKTTLIFITYIHPTICVISGRRREFADWSASAERCVKDQSK